MALSFINMDAEVKFGATLRLPASYPLGQVQAEPRIWFDGKRAMLGRAGDGHRSSWCLNNSAIGGSMPRQLYLCVIRHQITPLAPSPSIQTPAGEGQVSEQRIAAAVAAAPEAPGRLRTVCRQLSLLAREVLPRPAAAAQGDGTFHAGWTNPLFGSAPTVSAQS